MKFQDFKETEKLVELNLVARTACNENTMRRNLSEIIKPAMEKYGYDIRTLAVMAGTSVTQIKRLLHYELGGPLYLSTIFRVADILGFQLEFKMPKG